MQQHSSNYFARRSPPPDPGEVSQVLIQLFSEHGHVAYQIKWNHERSNMEQIFCPQTPPPPPPNTHTAEVGVTIQLFQNMAVMLHIKLNVIANAVTCKHIFCPGVGSKVKTILFLKVVILHIKFEGNGA